MRLLISAVVIASVFAAFIFGGLLESKTVYVYMDTAPEVPQIFYEPFSYNLSRNPNMSFASVIVPAVDQDGSGVATVLEVQVVPGTGKSLVNIDKLLFWVDTQTSIRTAKYVAEKETGKNLSGYDIVYTIRANASVVEGPSAGAALTIATIAAVEKKKVNIKVMLTGTINQDGTIGPIGGALEKAKAAKLIGADIFLVPLNQSVEVTYEPVKKCEKSGWADYCTIENVPHKKNIESEAGIRIVEVADIKEAMAYFFSGEEA